MTGWLAGWLVDRLIMQFGSGRKKRRKIEEKWRMHSFVGCKEKPRKTEMQGQVQKGKTRLERARRRRNEENEWKEKEGKN